MYIHMYPNLILRFTNESQTSHKEECETVAHILPFAFPLHSPHTMNYK